MINKTNKITVSGMLLAVGIILPFVTAHGLGIPGTVLLPMHFPVLLCGFLCGPVYGLLLGLILPLISSILTGMPSIYPMAPIMTMELMTYGFIAGILSTKTKICKKRIGLYITLIIAMICGRIMYGITFAILLSISGSLKALTVWAAIAAGIPGILVQLLLIPAIIMMVNQPFIRRQKDAIKSAINIIQEDRASCIIIKNNIIVKAELGSGIAPLIDLYEGGILKDSFVVDKIIGKAAAMVITLGGVKGCYGITVSKSAINWLESHNVSVKYDHCVELISNRTGDGMCPMEQTVDKITDATEAVTALKNKIKELRKNS